MHILQTIFPWIFNFLILSLRLLQRGRIKNTDHRQAADHQPTDRSSTDPLTHRQVQHRPTGNRLTNRLSTDPPTADHRLTDPITIDH